MEPRHTGPRWTLDGIAAGNPAGVGRVRGR